MTALLARFCFAGHGRSKLQGLCARGARVEEQAFGLNVFVRGKGHFVRGEDLFAVADAQRRFAPGVAALMKLTAPKTRIGERPRSNHGIVYLHVVGSLFQAEADRMNGDAAVA